VYSQDTIDLWQGSGKGRKTSKGASRKEKGYESLLKTTTENRDPHHEGSPRKPRADRTSISKSAVPGKKPNTLSKPGRENE